MKKTLSWLIVLALVLSMTPAVFATEAVAIVDGNNEIELVRGATEASVYEYVATQTGTLYVVITEYKYSASWTDGLYEEEYDMYDFENQTIFTVNGETLSGLYYGAVEVVEGETYTFSWAPGEDCSYGFLATLNLSYTDENVPVLGIDIPFAPADLPMTVEVPAGETVTYLVETFEFNGYVLTFTGENYNVSYGAYNMSTWEFETVVLEPVDGKVELDVGTAYIQEFQINNTGDEATTVTLDSYAPAGGAANPIVVESLDEIECTILAESEAYTYFIWTATEVGTLWVTPGSFYVSLEKPATEEYGKYDDTWENYYIYVEEGDELLIVISGWVAEETVFTMESVNYSFVPGYREGAEQNPIVVDLLEGMDASLYAETNYYSWTPAEDMTVVVNFTLENNWSTRVPTMLINGEEFVFGVIDSTGAEVSVSEELTVTAGEAVVFSLSAEGSTYGTLQATVVENTEPEPTDPTDPEPTEPTEPEPEPEGAAVTVGSINANVGDEVTVDVTIEAITMTAFGLTVNFDAEALELTAIEKGEAIDAFMGFVGNKKNGTITGFNTEDLDVEGVLFTMTFTVLADGDHEVSLTIDSFNMADQSEVAVYGVAGTVSAHTFGEGVVTAPTCTEQGYTTYTCEGCGKVTVSDYVDALGHTFVVDEAVAPTCTETGLTEGSHCDVCGYVDIAQEVVEATGHTFVVDEAVAPTCQNVGWTEGSHCEICGEVEVAQEEIPVVEHNYVDNRCEYCGMWDPTAIMLGDVNGDFEVNYLDAMLIAMYYVGDINAEHGFIAGAADVNGDGAVNYLDAMMIAMFYVGEITEF